MTLLEKIKSLIWYNLVNQLKDILTTISGNSIPDSPQDGETYGRQDGYWTPVSGGSGSGIQSITGNVVNNSDPLNPTIEVYGNETKVIAGNGIQLTGYGTINNPYTVTSTLNLDTVLQNGSTNYGKLIKMTFGTQGSPYFFNYYIGAPYGYYIEQGMSSDQTSYKRVEISPASGLLLKTNSVGDGTARLRADNLLATDRNFQFPDASGTMALQSSASGSFVSNDNKTVVVENGIITSIA